MRKITAFLAFFGVFFLTTASTPAFSEEFYTNVEKSIIFYLNMIRINPWDFLKRRGINVEKLKKSMSSMEINLLNNLSPLSPNKALTLAAREHVEDMLNNLYLSHISLDGRDPYQRALGKGYKGLMVSESIGVMVFTNYVDPLDAAITILMRIAESAVSGDPEGVNIFFGFKDVGVGFSGKEISVGGEVFNVYILCLDFGIPIGGSQ